MQKRKPHSLLFLLSVRLTGIEPALREELDPKSSASANSATGANADAKLMIFFVMTIKKVFFLCLRY